MKEILQKHFGFLFEEALQEEIIKLGEIKNFIADTIIIDIGEPLTYIPLLVEGNIKILREDQDEHELLLYMLEQGDTCAMSLSCCNSKTRSKIRAVAESDVSVIMIPSKAVKSWNSQFESWRNFMLDSYHTRFDEMLETIDTLAFMDMGERLYKYLTDSVKLKSETLLHKTHQQIAEDLNTSRVVISRLLKRLENEKKIKLFRNKIQVLEF